MIGKVKSFSRLKGYGFIISEKMNRDIFLHYTDIQGVGFRFLKAGDYVRFEYDKKERKAVNVQKISTKGQ